MVCLLLSVNSTVALLFCQADVVLLCPVIDPDVKFDYSCVDMCSNSNPAVADRVLSVTSCHLACL